MATGEMIGKPQHNMYRILVV